MIRAAAKNYQDVAVVTAPDDYPAIVEELRASGGELSLDTKWRLAKKVFRTTADYDSAISARLEQVRCAGPSPALPDALAIRAPKLMDLRYGENPHQSAALYGRAGRASPAPRSSTARSSATTTWWISTPPGNWSTSSSAPPWPSSSTPIPAAAPSRIRSPRLTARRSKPIPVSAYGGVIGINRTIDEETAREIAKTFVEAIAAPGYSPEALAILGAKKNLRLMRVAPGADPLVVKSISGGYLAQTADSAKLDRASAVVKTQRAPSADEWVALEFGWKVAKHVKSNAIVYARAGQTVGVGAGQMSRVDSVKIGAMKAVLPLAGTVVASDAFFPFADGVEEAVKNGATAFIQPGGSCAMRM